MSRSKSRGGGSGDDQVRGIEGIFRTIYSMTKVAWARWGGGTGGGRRADIAHNCVKYFRVPAGTPGGFNTGTYCIGAGGLAGSLRVELLIDEDLFIEVLNEVGFRTEGHKVIEGPIDLASEASLELLHRFDVLLDVLGVITPFGRRVLSRVFPFGGGGVRGVGGVSGGSASSSCWLRSRSWLSRSRLRVLTGLL